MRTTKNLFALLAMLVMSVLMVSCGNDEDETLTSDLGSAIAGVYTGKLTVNNTVTADAYVVSVYRISSTVVSIEADFLSDKKNFNVNQDGSQYILTSETVNNITITVIGKSISINFLNQAGGITTYLGTRD